MRFDRSSSFPWLFDNASAHSQIKSFGFWVRRFYLFWRWTLKPQTWHSQDKQTHVSSSFLILCHRNHHHHHLPEWTEKIQGNHIWFLFKRFILNASSRWSCLLDRRDGIIMSEEKEKKWFSMDPGQVHLYPSIGAMAMAPTCRIRLQCWRYRIIPYSNYSPFSPLTCFNSYYY